MPSNGTEDMSWALVSQLLKDKKSGKGRDNRHYFYIIQMPKCGDYRIKTGKSSNIYARFKSYQDHLYGDEIVIKELRYFTNTDVDRYGDNAMKLYALYEREVGYWLREFNKNKTKRGLGILTEWYDGDEAEALMKEYNKFPDEFSKMKFDKTIKRKGLRSRYNISDTESSSSSEEEVRVRSTRNKNKPNRYKP